MRLAPLSGCAALAAATLAAVLLAGDDPAGRTATARTPVAAPIPAPAVDPALTAAFSILRRERTAADTLGGRTNGIPETEYHGTLVKRLPDAAPMGAAAPRASEGFVAPGPRGTLCLLYIAPGFDGPGGMCLPRPDALAGELMLAVGAVGDAVELSGIVPDGVATVTVTTRTGDRARLPVVGNAYAALLSAPPAEVRFRTPGGELRRLRYGA